MDPKKLKEFKNHERIINLSDKRSGLRGFIAIHNTNLGTAVGGTRFFPYKSDLDALKDVLKLSRAMTYKCALADVPFGGGKAVIIGDPKKGKSKELLMAYAEELNKLKGSFYTGEDVGISKEDVQFMLNYSKYFIGRPDAAKDPSPYAALSVYYALKEAVKIKFNSDSIDGLSFAIKGVGKVGMDLATRIYQEGGKIIIADIDKEAIEKALSKMPKVKIVDHKKIHSQKVDIFSPNALGCDVRKDNIDEIKASIICGGANNQLENDDLGYLLKKKDILYVPDYVANAGGLIAVVGELEVNGFNQEKVMEKIINVRKTINTIVALGKKNNLPTNINANKLAEEKFLENS